jgi:sulfur-oxidizing protein SoxZ
MAGAAVPTQASVGRAVVSVPAQAKRGEVIEIKTLAAHPMETGFRRTQVGELIPRDIIRLFVCTYNGEEIFRAELQPAVSANPLIAFSTVATESGRFEFRWSGDNGYSVTQSATITVF